MNETSETILALAAEIAKLGVQRMPMQRADALRQVATSSADPRVRELAWKRLRSMAPPVLNIGRRFERTGKASQYGPRYGDKLARRIERRRAIRAASRIEHEIDKARKRNNDTRAMASNSHEARRVIEEDRRLARAER